LRDAPALDIIKMLLKLGAKVKAYDPIVSHQSVSHSDLAGINLVGSPELLAEGSDAIVLMTEWSEFQELDYQNLVKLMRSPLMVDCRNFLSAETITNAGFTYIGIGC
jgi:UDPglucose 6-dehydrogenase